VIGHLAYDGHDVSITADDTIAVQISGQAGAKPATYTVEFH
jgi:hypothetical protein